MRLLVTGFEPFDNESINPSKEVLNLLVPEEGIEIVTAVLPVVRFESLKRMEEKINEVKPDLILSIGQAGGRNCLSVERIGINCDDYRIPDAAGNQPCDEKIAEDGPDAYFATLPIRKMTEAASAAGIPAVISDTAGTYVCNHVLYGTLHMCHEKYPHIRCGFIHVPYLPAQCAGKNAPSMSLNDIAAGIQCAIRVLREECV